MILTFGILDIVIASSTSASTGGGGGGIATPGRRRKRGSIGIMEELTELIRKKREVRYRCNMTMTYGVMFYDIRNKEVKIYFTYVKLLSY